MRRSRRGLSRCSARATSSLPVPLSPSISTGNAVTAARADRLAHRRDTGAAPDDLRGATVSVPRHRERIQPAPERRGRQRGHHGHRFLERRAILGAPPREHATDDDATVANGRRDHHQAADHARRHVGGDERSGHVGRRRNRPASTHRP